MTPIPPKPPRPRRRSTYDYPLVQEIKMTYQVTRDGAHGQPTKLIKPGRVETPTTYQDVEVKVLPDDPYGVAYAEGVRDGIRTGIGLQTITIVALICITVIIVAVIVLVALPGEMG